MLKTSLVLLALGSAAALAENNMTEMSAMMYLTRYGYMDAAAEMMNDSAMNYSNETMKMAIQQFQTMADMPLTGELDTATMEMMKKPRCGNKDMMGTTRNTRSKRYALIGMRLRKRKLSYVISRYSCCLPNAVVDKELARAFRMWSQYVDLRFFPTKSRSRADIDVRFVRRAHGDGEPFDGPRGVLAHASFPARSYGSIIHFDDEEGWSDSTAGQNLYQTALHELGHTLGLHHSPLREAVMYMSVSDNEPDIMLHTDDIQGVQALYGARFGHLESNITDKSMSLATTIDKELCQDPTVDTIFLNMQGVMIAFKGDKYYLLTDAGVVVGYPRDISTTWPELPSHIDAASSYRDGKTYFFKGSQLWRYNDTALDPGFPKQISQMFPGIPDSVNDVMEWNINGLMYFFKGSEFWALDPTLNLPLNKKYPLPLSNWEGVPNDINAAFVYKDKTFFFKRDKFYGFNNFFLEVDTEDPPYPRNTRHYWFGCARNSDGNGAETPTDRPTWDSMPGEVGSSSGSGVEKINACVLLAALLALSRNVY